MNWNNLEHLDQLDQISEASYTTPQVIFKHSSTCSISTMAKLRMESNWSNLYKPVDFYFLDLKRFRTLSNEIAERFQVYHESPQIIMIKDGVAEYDSSHFDISVEDLNESLKYIYG